MKKNTKNSSDIFVKKIVKKWKKILKKSEILSFWLSSGGMENRLSYALSLLKNAKILQKISSDFYLVNAENPLDFYWEIIAKIVAENALTGAIIGSEKSLEMTMKNFSPPEILILYTENFSGRFRLFDGYEVHFRTIETGEKMGRKNFFKILKTYSHKHENFSKIFVPCAEISLLEALSHREQGMGNNDFLITKFLQKNHKKLDKNILLEITKYRYIRAVNRLRAMARDAGYSDLYANTLEVIKISGGGVFLNV